MEYDLLCPHEYKIIDIVEELMERGFIVYLEYEIETDQFTPTGRIKRLVPDVYARKDDRVIIVEVGWLVGKTRLTDLKRIMPKAQIYHFPNWNNFMQGDIYRAEMEAWGNRMAKQRLMSIEKMGKTLGQK